jgi:hypothetical protein
VLLLAGHFRLQPRIHLAHHWSTGSPCTTPNFSVQTEEWLEHQNLEKSYPIISKHIQPEYWSVFSKIPWSGDSNSLIIPGGYLRCSRSVDPVGKSWSGNPLVANYHITC